MIIRMNGIAEPTALAPVRGPCGTVCANCPSQRSCPSSPAGKLRSARLASRRRTFQGMGEDTPTGAKFFWTPSDIENEQRTVDAAVRTLDDQIKADGSVTGTAFARGWDRFVDEWTAFNKDVMTGIGGWFRRHEGATYYKTLEYRKMITDWIKAYKAGAAETPELAAAPNRAPDLLPSLSRTAKIVGGLAALGIVGYVAVKLVQNQPKKKERRGHAPAAA